MKRIAFVTILFLATPLWADQPTPAPAAEATVVDPAARAAARELLDAMNAKNVIDTLRQQMDVTFDKLMADLPLKTDADRAAAQRAKEKAVALIDDMISWERMEPMMLRIYSKVYTAEELHDIAVFYRSPPGQKLLAKMPQVMQESMQESLQMMKDLMPKMQQLANETRSELEKSPSSPN